MVSLAELTTLRVGGPAGSYVVARSSDELVDAVRAADAAGSPVLLVGGGSNLVVADAGFPGTVISVASRGVTPESVDYCGGAVVRVAAGEPWDAFVEHAAKSEWIGIEALSGIPGSVGATPVQNVGAYGQEVSSTVAQVRTWDRVASKVKTFAAAECGFGYRDSLFKRTRLTSGPSAGGPRYVVLEVVFQFVVGSRAEPVRYGELSRVLETGEGERVSLFDVREAVLDLRRGKGMVLDASDHDTWSAGSFFTNPVLSSVPSAVPDDAPRWPAGSSTKLSAAWLIEHAGFAKGYGLPGPASLSTKHTLALTNRGSASAADVVRLAREVRNGVQARFGVTLVPEPELVGLTL
ncbi:UDP-N-acetylmuramate dehydrogenase [Spongisporangium articulatum]|uniref:UDP-N-acetylenolpyruvoylglucosamine reductase n=1 Tax=Spongisporangium articulatum TaxID=3362603 RepID=A0ABW8ANX2_9ACTN